MPILAAVVERANPDRPTRDHPRGPLGPGLGLQVSTRFGPSERAESRVAMLREQVVRRLEVVGKQRIGHGLAKCRVSMGHVQEEIFGRARRPYAPSKDASRIPIVALDRTSRRETVGDVGIFRGESVQLTVSLQSLRDAIAHCVGAPTPALHPGHSNDRGAPIASAISTCTTSEHDSALTHSTHANGIVD